MVNTPANSPEAPQKVSAIPGLGTKIMTALTALGIMASAEKVEGATVVIGGTLPTSTVSTPTLLAGTPGTITDTATSIAGASRLVISSTGTGITGTYGSRFQVTLSAGDLDTYGGTLTITGYYGRSVSSAGASVDNDLNSRFAYKIGSGSEVDLLTFDGPRSLNDTTASPLTTPIGDNNNYSFSKEITIGPGAQTIDFTNYATLENIRAGNVRIYGDPAATQGLNFSFEKNLVPEPSTGLLVGGAVGAFLLRRRRGDKNSQQ